MKGLSHFISGVAIATFFPEVVHQAAAGGLLPVLGGIGGILPDTVDFKFARYWERFDVSIDPGPDPNAEAIADALLAAMQKAYAEGKDQHVITHTIRLAADLWRQYVIRFDTEAGEIAVQIGPLVNTGQVPYAGTEPEGAQVVRRKVGVPLVHTYSEEYKVNIFSGPTFRFAREGDKLRIHFLDWHHRWTHSLILALGVGLLAGGLLALATGNFALARLGGLVTWLGYSGHVLEDQLGHMGSNLFWPWTHKRIPGLALIHAGDAAPNFLTVWTALALILFNLDRFSAQSRLPQAPYLLLLIGLPWTIYIITRVARHLREHDPALSSEALQQTEHIAEAERTDFT